MAAQDEPEEAAPHEWPFTEHGPTWYGEKADADYEPDPRWDDFATTAGKWTESLPPQSQSALVTVPFVADDAAVVETCMAALARDGAVILGGAVTPETCDSLLADMQPYLDATPGAVRTVAAGGGDDGAAPEGTLSGTSMSKRVGAVIARSEHSYPIVGHPVLMKLGDGILGRQALRYDRTTLKDRNRLKQIPWGLHLTQLIEVAPGAEAQGLHYDGGFCPWDLHQTVEHEISTIWALDDFPEEIGATRLVVGSHLWPRNRKPAKEESCGAAMTKGSCVMYLSSCWHGSGTNATARPRRGLNVDYITTFLRSEENQYLSNPPAVAARYPTHIQKLVGYTRRGGSMGYVSDFEHPKVSLAKAAAEERIDWATPPLGPWAGHTSALAAEIVNTSWAGLGGTIQEGAEDDSVASSSLVASATPSFGDTTGLSRPTRLPTAFTPPNPRWDVFQDNVGSWIAKLPPTEEGPVSVAWTEDDQDDQDVIETLLAALYRDGAVILTNAVSDECADAVVAEMSPYVDAARDAKATADVQARFQRNNRGDDEAVRGHTSTRVGSVPSRSASSWPIMLHPALMKVCEAVIGRQVLHMDRHELKRKLVSPTGPGGAEQVPWCLHLTQMIEVDPQCSAQGLHQDGGYMQFSLQNEMEHEISTIWALCDFTDEIGATRELSRAAILCSTSRCHLHWRAFGDGLTT